MRKPIELPPEVACRFIADMRAFFAVKDGIKRDEIAARQAWLLNPFQALGLDRRVPIHSPHEMNSRPAQAANASTTKSFQTRVAAWRLAARQLHAREHYSGKLDLPT